MTARELKERLTEEDIRKLLCEMGAVFYYEDEKFWITDTVCHHGEKPKLYFYKDSMSFHCYTECGQMDVIGVVMGYKGYEKTEFQKAIDWICARLGIGSYACGFGAREGISDWEFIRQYKRNRKKGGGTPGIPAYDAKILGAFQDFFYKGWMDEGISAESMKKYGIKYCTWQQKIIIPHYDANGRLVGIRTRALDDAEAELFGKYSPFRIGKKIYNHPLGENLYGLDKNLKAIRKKRKIMLVEGEKSVLQADTMFGMDNFTVALCGNNLTDSQKWILVRLGVREVIVALDKQYLKIDSDEYRAWVRHLKEKVIDKISPFAIVTVLWDTDGILEYKDSPTDKGKEALLRLMDKKIYVGTN